MVGSQYSYIITPFVFVYMLVFFELNREFVLGVF